MDWKTPQLGVIEGFFGPPWSWRDRLDYQPFLAAHGYSFYIYAPKADPFLRKRWREPLPETLAQSLATLSEKGKKHGIQVGVGFSPFEAYRDYDASSRRQIQSKIKSLNPFSRDILCVLFDDMRGDYPNLAKVQSEILGDLRQASEARTIVFCPTYYSYDPIIERCFGAMPPRYLEDLGEALDPSIEIFWTGPRVMSTEYPAAHLQEVAERLSRKPFLWDNYPVNDSKNRSPFINLRAFENRGADLKELVSGHAVNPMKQAWLSQIPLATLIANYSSLLSDNREASTRASMLKLCGAELGEMIYADLRFFTDIGLDNLSPKDRAYLSDRYEKDMTNPFCSEILGWLRGDYAFDPACLTD